MRKAKSSGCTFNGRKRGACSTRRTAGMISVVRRVLSLEPLTSNQVSGIFRYVPNACAQRLISKPQWMELRVNLAGGHVYLLE
jgi:hypothetical protein